MTLFRPPSFFTLSFLYRRTRPAADRKRLRIADGACALLFCGHRFVPAAARTGPVGSGVPGHVKRRPATRARPAAARTGERVVARPVCGRRADVSQRDPLAGECISRYSSVAAGAAGVLLLPAIHAECYARRHEASRPFSERTVIRSGSLRDADPERLVGRPGFTLRNRPRSVDFGRCRRNSAHPARLSGVAAIGNRAWGAPAYSGGTYAGPPRRRVGKLYKGGP